MSFRKVYGKYKLSEFRPTLEAGLKAGFVQLKGFKVKCSSVRLRLFASTDCTCVRCGRKADTFVLESLDAKAVRPHLNLYGRREDGSELLFTKDHILPKALSGSDMLVNMQVMCIDCNSEKGVGIQLPDVPKIIGQVFRGEASLAHMALASYRAGREK